MLGRVYIYGSLWRRRPMQAGEGVEINVTRIPGS